MGSGAGNGVMLLTRCRVMNSAEENVVLKYTE